MLAKRTAYVPSSTTDQSAFKNIFVFRLSDRGARDGINVFTPRITATRPNPFCTNERPRIRAGHVGDDSAVQMTRL